jgi:hypothetical protein
MGLFSYSPSLRARPLLLIGAFGKGGIRIERVPEREGEKELAADE